MPPVELALVKHGSGILVPDRAPDEEFVRKMKMGEVIVGDFKKPRNGAFHRKAFALCQIMFDSQERFPTMDAMLRDIKIKTGHYDHYITSDGEVVYCPRSISYREMDAHAFDEWYPKLVDLALKDPIYLRGMDADALEEELQRRLNFM